MKRIVLLVVSFLMTFSVVSSSKSADMKETCRVIANLAESTMIKRQQGVSMSQLVENAGSEGVRGQIIMESYECPRYSTEEMRKRTIEDFRDKWYLTCFKSYAAAGDTVPSIDDARPKAPNIETKWPEIQYHYPTAKVGK